MDAKPGSAMMRLQLFTDPLYGSERYIEFEPAWVVEVEDRIIRLVPWILKSRHYPATYIKFKDGRHYVVDGHVAAQIKAAQQ